MNTRRRSTKQLDLDGRIRAAKVTAADLNKAMKAVDSLPAEDRQDFTARAIAIMKAFGLMTGKKHESPERDRDLIEKVTAIQIRIEAMARLVDQNRFKSWTMCGAEEGLMYISEYFLDVAATAPIRGGKRGKPNYFDEDEFARRMLEVSKEEGRA